MRTKSQSVNTGVTDGLHPTVPVIIARLSDKSKNHGENLMESEPYLASWFAYCLKGDKEAGMAFMGASPETIVLPLLFPL